MDEDELAVVYGSPREKRSGASSPESSHTRAAYRAVRARQRRQRRRDARLRRGQTLIIFALSFTVLLSLAGLAIDVARAYDLYARMQRAAEAGAIAGVLYLPSYYNSARPADGITAVERASAEVVKDGFGTAITSPTASDCPSPVGSVEVAICTVPNAPTDLEVFITEHMNLVLLSGLGLNGITLQVKAQADYMPPIQIGSRENYFGDEVECSSGGSSNTNTSACQPSATGVSHLQYFMASMNGPAELKEDGDPYVYCAEGNAQNPPDPSSGPQLYTYNGMPTGHPQWTGVSNGWSGISQYCGRATGGSSNPGNPDFQPDGYDGPATNPYPTHQGGYNYFVGISQTVSAATLWIYNPYYIPQDNCPSAPPLDHFNDGSTGSLNCTATSTPPSNYYQGPRGEGLGQTNQFISPYYHDAPLFYFNVTYSLYSVNSLYDRGGEDASAPLATETFPPYDATTQDLSLHGCATDGSQVYDPYNQQGGTTNAYYLKNNISHGQGCVNSNQLGATSVCAGDGQWCQLMICPTSGTASAPTPITPTTTCQPLTICGYGITCLPGGAASTGAYRLVVEATGLNASPNPGGTPLYNSGPQDGWGTYTYALKICAGSPSTPINCSNGDGSQGAGGFNNSQVNIYGWNNVDVRFLQPLGTPSPNANFPQTSCVTSNANSYACLDLGCLTSAFAGRTLTLRIFDPGAGSGSDFYVGVVAPYVGAATVSYPSGVTTSTLDGDKVVQTVYGSTGYKPYRGQWLNVTLSMAPTFQGDCFSTGAKSGRTGWFQLAVISPSATATSADTLAAEFTLVGSPVHLVVPN